MAVINYPFQVINASGVGVTGIVFGTTVGSSPGIKSIDKLPTTVGGTLTAIGSPAISFLEKSDGIYLVQFDADAQAADVLLVLDAANSLTGANRYIPVTLARDSSRIITNLDAQVSTRNSVVPDNTTIGLINTAVAELQVDSEEVNARVLLALPATAAGGTGGLSTVPVVASVTILQGVLPGATVTSSGVKVDSTDAVYNISYPRNTQKSYLLILSQPITGRTITWVVKALPTDGVALLTHDNAGIGGITLNTGPVTIGGVVYPANQVATLTIAAADCSSTTVFPEGAWYWHGFKLNSPNEEPAYGEFIVSTEP